MNFLNVGPLELLLILVVALIVFGPRRLPEIGAAIGRAVREFRQAQQEIVNEMMGGDERSQHKRHHLPGRSNASAEQTPAQRSFVGDDCNQQLPGSEIGTE